MSKKKGKPASKKTSKKVSKKVAKKPVRRAASAGMARATLTEGTSGRGYTSQVTIFLFRTGNGNKIRTAPQRAYAGPGQVEWTVVNMIDGSDVPVNLTWVGDSPFKPIEFRGRHTERIPDGVKGTFKYVVHAYDAKEDPEVEIPWN